MRRIVVLEITENTTSAPVFYVEEKLHNTLTMILNSSGMPYESQVVSSVLPEDGDNWLPVGWSGIREEITNELNSLREQHEHRHLS